MLLAVAYQAFLETLNYARMYNKDLSKLVWLLYSKCSAKGQKYFNSEAIKLVQKIKEEIKKVPDFHLPLDLDYKIVQTDGCELGWAAVLLAKENQYSNEERIYRYASGKYRNEGNLASIDFEILAIIGALESFKLYLNNPFTIRTDCKAIKKYQIEFLGHTIGDGKIKLQPHMVT